MVSVYVCFFWRGGMCVLFVSVLVVAVLCACVLLSVLRFRWCVAFVVYCCGVAVCCACLSF